MLILEDGPEDGCFFSVLDRFSIPDIRLLHGRSLFREEIKGCANFRVHCISFPTACSGTAWYCMVLQMVDGFNIQWPFQEPELEVPTIYKAYGRAM